MLILRYEHYLSGDIVTSSLTQPPDIAVTLKCLTGNTAKGSVISRNFSGSVKLSQIVNAVAADAGLISNFQATDKNISNYAFSGSALDQVNQLNSYGGINVFVDNGILVAKNGFVPITGALRVLSAETGMIGIPEFTEQGIRVKFLIDNRTTLGGALQIISQQYPATNGRYVIYKLGFQIATREVPFYYIAEASRIR